MNCINFLDEIAVPEPISSGISIPVIFLIAAVISAIIAVGIILIVRTVRKNKNK